MSAHADDPPPTTAARAAADERWDRAVSIARGRPAPAALVDQRRRRRRVWWVLAGGVVLCLALGVVAGLLFGGSGHERSPSAVREDLQLVLTAVALVMIVVGVVIAARSGHWGARWTSPLTPLDRAERRQVMREIRGRQQPDPQHTERLAVSADVASRLARPWGTVLGASGVAVNVVGQVVGGSAPPWLTAVMAFTLVVVIAAVVLLLRDQRAARRFLDRHAPQLPLGVEAVR